MNITVEYPTTIKVVIKTAAQAKAMGYGANEIAKYIPTNRPLDIAVKQLSRRVQEEFMDYEDYEAELDAKALQQIRMTRSAFQSKFKKAWNE